jgi:hypothetical protein
MYDIEREHERRTYQVCRFAFAANAVAYILLSFTSLVGLFGRFEPGLVTRIHNAAWYPWLDVLVVWCSLIGATLLWGRWDHASWQRRSGLLLLMCLVDLGLWFMDRRDAVGARVGEIGHEWLRQSLAQALGWAEFALLTSLTCDYLVHLGVEHARDSDKSTRSMIATGAMVWLLLFCQATNWAAGWPLQARQLRGLEGLLLVHGVSLIWAITLIQVTALLISAMRQSTHVLAEIQQEEQECDLLRSRSDPSPPLENAWADRSKTRQSV